MRQHVIRFLSLPRDSYGLEQDRGTCSEAEKAPLKVCLTVDYVKGRKCDLTHIKWPEYCSASYTMLPCGNSFVIEKV